MTIAQPVAIHHGELDPLSRAQDYLKRRKQGLPADRALETAWLGFYDRSLQQIRKFAFRSGATAGDIADCVQEVWAELLKRLPAFQLDTGRGQFDTWLFHIVRGKTANLRRAHKRRLFQDNSTTLQTVLDNQPGPARALEDNELVALVWNQLKSRLSACSFHVLRLRLLENRPVTEVAEQLGLSHEQVWYRYHRARRELELIGAAWKGGRRTPSGGAGRLQEEKMNTEEFAQGKLPSRVSPTVGISSRASQRDPCVDYVFQRLELGRRELNPEWKVEWDCAGVPRSVLYIRKMAIVAYAEICGPVDFVNTHWPRIVNAAVTAGVAAGIATIVATPTAALPIFQMEFYKLLHSKGSGPAEEKIQVALSAKQEANGPWCVCKA